MRKILLGEEKSKKSINEDNFVNVEISSKEHVLPVDNVTQTLDSYEEYLSEKDSSDIYRLIFTINPVCSNILFNAISEIVYKEGSDECFCIGSGGTMPENASMQAYWTMKGGKTAPYYVCSNCGVIFDADSGGICPGC